MLVPAPPMLGFRTLQAIMDLRATAGRQPRSAIRGVAAYIPPTDHDRGGGTEALTRVILHQGGRLERAEDVHLLDALKLAASQPDADMAAFAAATAILLADRLQHGLGDEALGRYWETFQSDYRSLPAHDRAAIVQGYLAGRAVGRVAMGAPKLRDAHLTESTETVLSALRDLVERRRADLQAAVAEAVGAQSSALSLPHLRMLMAGASREPLTGDSPIFEPLLAIASDASQAVCVPATALLLHEAIKASDEEGWFAVTLWPDMARTWLALDAPEGRPILAGLRHIYEADSDWVPMPDRVASPHDMAGVSLLPVLDAGYSGGLHGGRVG